MQLNYKNNQKLLTSIDKKYQGFVHFSGDSLYEPLYRQYPNSVFIFNTRKFGDWLISFKQHLKRHSEQKNKQDLDRKLEQATQRYHTKSREIRRFFKNKQDRYLEIDICAGDGWDKLCDFLNLPVPEQAFPRIK
jgi:hypothetical protein